MREVKLLPSVQPSKVILIGLNHEDAARELKMGIPKEPIVFMKSSNSVVASGENIIYPLGVKRLDYEAEPAVVIKKKKCKKTFLRKRPLIIF